MEDQDNGGIPAANNEYWLAPVQDEPVLAKTDARLGLNRPEVPVVE